MGTYLEAELDSPNVLTLDLSVDVVRATATPTILPTIDDCVETVTRLGVDLIG
jgi:hypothetical protein